MAKQPSFQFYPGDWLRNEVSGCPLEAQGLWLRMMIVMHDAEVYGELSINGQPMPDEIVAKKCGISRRIYRKYLKFLDDFSVVSRKPNGVIYSGRMVRDEAKRQQNAARQRRYYDVHKNDQQEEPNAKPNAPSSSSSSSFRKDTHKEAATEGDWGWPVQPLIAAFPDIAFSPSAIGFIQSRVLPGDEDAWAKTIDIYRMNYDPALKRYLPDKVANLLGVFDKQKAEIDRQKNGTNKTNNRGTKRTDADVFAESAEFYRQWEEQEPNHLTH